MFTLHNVPSRIRAPPAQAMITTTSPTTSPTSTSAIEHLRQALKELSLSAQDPTESLHKLRHILIDSDPRIKEEFRRQKGYQSLLELLSSFRDFYLTVGHDENHAPSRDERIRFFEILNGACGVLAASFHDHAVNRRYFTKLSPQGGWLALEAAVVDTAVAKAPFMQNTAVQDALELLFGILFSFSVCDDSHQNIFRAISKVYDGLDPIKDNKQVVDALRSYFKTKLNRNQVLQNPEIVPIAFRIWKIVCLTCLAENKPNSLLWAVLIAFQTLQTMSLRNEAALYSARLLQPLLSLYVQRISFPGIQTILQSFIENLLKFGVNTLDEAYQLFNHAAKTEGVDGLLLHGLITSRYVPSFIQFDHSLHAYSSIELSSIGRSFPPHGQPGYSIISWIKFDKFDPNHHVTIFGLQDRTESCFVALFIEKENHQLVLQTSLKGSQQRVSVIFRNYTFKLGQWYHIAIVHRRSTAMSNSKVGLLINGNLVDQIRCPYPSSPPTRRPSSESLPSSNGSNHQQHESVRAFLGTPKSSAPQIGQNLVQTKWSLASFYLISDTVSEELLSVIHAVGPRYIGNFQDALGLFQTYRASAEVHVKNENNHPKSPDSSKLMHVLKHSGSKFLPESNIVISFSPTGVLDNEDSNHINETKLSKSLSHTAKMTLSQQIHQLGASVIINSAVTSYNEALTCPHGMAFLTGEPVVVIPNALDDACWRISGSAPVVLNLLELAKTKNQVLRAVHIIFQSLEGSWRNSEVLERENAYGVLAGLMREKLGFDSFFSTDGSVSNRNTIPVDPSEREELALELLRMTLSFVGYNESNPETASMINSLAYRFLLVEFDTWRKAPIATQKLYYSQFVHFTARGKHHRFNIKRLICMRIVKRFIDALKGEVFDSDVLPDFLEAFEAVWKCSISGETLRMVPLFITYALQEYRSQNEKQIPQKSTLLTTQYATNGSRPNSIHGTSSIGPKPSPRSTPFKEPLTPQNEVSKYEIGLQMLELLADLLFEPGFDTVNKFAKAVTNKWLLNLLAEDDVPIIVLAVKILSRILVVHGTPYIKAFNERNGGFAILKRRLQDRWSIPAVWISLFAILFGIDPSSLDYNEDFNQFTLSEAFVKSSGKVIYPEVLPVITSMLEGGLRQIVQEGQNKSSDSPSLSTLNITAVKGYSNFESTNNTEVLSAVGRFLIDMHIKWSNFRDFTVQSNFLKEILHAIYPVVVTTDNVSAEMELNSRDSILTFDGQDVPVGSSNHLQKPSIVRNTSDTSLSKSGTTQTPNDTQTHAQPHTHTQHQPRTKRPSTFTRPSSYILISPDSQMPQPARIHAIISITNNQTKSIPLKIGNSIREILMKLVSTVFLDQVLYRKEFPGFNFYLKAPPAFQEHQAYFESYLLANIMNDLSNTFRLQEQSLIEGRVITNIARYANIMAEAVFEGWFMNGIELLLDFIGQRLEFLQSSALKENKTVRLCRPAMQSLKTTFMRLALFQLSELQKSSTTDSELEFLRKIQSWQNILLTEEDDVGISFLRLLFFQLYFRIIASNLEVRNAAINFLRILIFQRPDEASEILEIASPSKQRYLATGFLKVAELDNETFLVWLDHNRPELNTLFFDALHKPWEEFIADENKKIKESAKTRSSKRKDKLRQWVDDDQTSETHWRKHEGSTSRWRSNVHASERIKYLRSLQDQQESLAFMALTLDKFDRILRAPCNVFEDAVDVKWRLDETEGINRNRIRLVIDREPSGIEYVAKISHQRTRSRANSALNSKVETSSSSTPTVKIQESTSYGGRNRSNSDFSIVQQDEEYEFVDEPKDAIDTDAEDKNRKVMRTLKRNDVIKHIYNISRIDGLEAIESLLVIGVQGMYLIDYLFQRSDGEVVSIWQASSEERDPCIRFISGRKADLKKPRPTNGGQTSRFWSWVDVMLISKRRFLQRDVSVEVFFTDGRSYLLTASSLAMRNELYNKLCDSSPLLKSPSDKLNIEEQWRVESLYNVEEQPQSIGYRLANVFNSSGAFPATRKWMRGEISNFAYLMHINTLAGRTFNDLTQYPVFPWVLADYSSEELDLTDPRSFRDLSKPIGCQTPDREERARTRYANTLEMSEMHGEPPYNYGTHYSSSMTVCHYLVRLQPFVKSYLALQGDSFDHADRLFYSIAQTWHSVAKDPNSNDVRELTPEFFYLPEFLVNLNGYDLGLRQNNKGSIDNVQLPPWAKGNANIFIRKHREALESPYVSMHLHKWIDLIFGFKQQGEPAIEAANVFHHLTYQGSIDLDKVKDEYKLKLNISTIHNFGQTPQQIFSKLHPPRDEKYLQRNTLSSIVNNLSKTRVPMLEISEKISSLTLVPSRDRPIASSPFQLPMPPAYDIVLRWGFGDGSIRFFNAPHPTSSADNLVAIAPKSNKPIALYENLHIGPPSTATFHDSRTLITAGSDAVISVWTVSTTSGGHGGIELTQRESLFGHRAPITLLFSSKSLATLLSADSTGRVLLWDVNRAEFVRELQSSRQALAIAHKAGTPSTRSHSSNSSPTHTHTPVEISCAQIAPASGRIVLGLGRRVRVFTINGTLLVDRDVCGGDDDGINNNIDNNDATATADAVTACTWFEGSPGEWVERVLLFTGHRSGMVRVWGLACVAEAASATSASATSASAPAPASAPASGSGYASASGSASSRASSSSASWKLELLRVMGAAGTSSHSHSHGRMAHVPPVGLAGTERRPSPISCILVTGKIVYVGDEAGRVYEWTIHE